MRLAVLLAALAFAPAAHAAEPDLVLRGGKVWTGTGDVVSAVAVAGNRVVAIGEEATGSVGPRTRVVDLDGAFVMPGLADHHTHVVEQGDLGSLEPSWSGYDPVSAEAVRAAILGLHVANYATGQTPEDTCTSSPVTDALLERLLTAQELMARQGLTTVVEAGLSDLGQLAALQQLDREGKLRVRHAIRIGWGCIEEAAALGLRTGVGTDWVKILGVKLYSDGWLGPRSAALREPYADRPHSGFLFLGQPRADADVARARELGFNLTTHAIGDRGIDTTLAAYEHNGVGPGERAQVEHAQVLSDDLSARMAAVGAVASIQTSFATTDQRFAEDALGPERAARAYAWRTLMDRGVRLAGGSDYPVEVINPLWGLQRVVTRTEFDGTPPGGWHPAQRLTVEQALRLLTVDGAFARLEESDRGVIAPGRFADLVVVREDLLRLPADCLAAATVLMTMVNGRVTYEGEQAYPPGDASCPSGAAPARGAPLRSREGGSSEEEPGPAGPCSPRAPLARAGARPRGRGVRIVVPRHGGSVSVEVVRVASPVAPLTRPRRVARLGRHRRSFTWRGRGAGDGWYVVRLRGRRAARDLVVVRSRGRFSARPPFAIAGRCGLIEAFRLSSPVFGGRRGDPLDVSYRLARAGRVTLELVHEGRVVQRLGEGERRTARSYTLRIAAADRPAGDYAVRIRATAPGARSVGATLIARRL